MASDLPAEDVRELVACSKSKKQQDADLEKINSKQRQRINKRKW